MSENDDLKAIYDAMTPEEVFVEFDVDGSGFIDAKELEKLLKDLDFNVRNEGTVSRSCIHLCYYALGVAPVAPRLLQYCRKATRPTSGGHRRHTVFDRPRIAHLLTRPLQTRPPP